MHEFDTSRKVEHEWAPVLDEWLGQHYWFREATQDEQWAGIDRVAVDDGGDEVGIDYKCDERARHTGNVFIETVSNSGTGRPGWAVTTKARWIFYFVTPNKVLAILTARLRAVLPEWRSRFSTRGAMNRWDGGTYATLGICVPIDVAEDVAEYVAYLDRDDGPVLPQEGDSDRE